MANGFKIVGEAGCDRADLSRDCGQPHTSIAAPIFFNHSFRSRRVIGHNFVHLIPKAAV